MHVILHPLAESELLEAVRFYEDRAPGLGKDLLQDFQRAVDRIHDNPESGVKMGQLVRRLLLRRFPFSILFPEFRR